MLCFLPCTQVRTFRYMYKVFGPYFLFKWLRKAGEDQWEAWHSLCVSLNEYIHPTSETSYLSLKKVRYTNASLRIFGGGVCRS